jgi:hypothetical protein
MAKVKIGFSRLSVSDQVERARNIKGKMAGNVNYTTPNPTLLVFEAAINALETAFNESRSRDKVKMATMRIRRAELLTLVFQLASYVQEASAGDEEKILSSGFDVRGAKTSHSVTAGAVNDVQVEDGSAEGKAVVSFDKADDAIIYIIEAALSVSPMPAPQFELKGYTTKTRREIGGLNRGSEYLIRVTAIGREEMGAHSNAVSYIAR